MRYLMLTAVLMVGCGKTQWAYHFNPDSYRAAHIEAGTDYPLEVERGLVRVGMTKEDVLAAWAGAHLASRNKILGRELWVFGSPSYGQRFVWFRMGQVESVSELGRNW